MNAITCHAVWSSLSYAQRADWLEWCGLSLQNNVDPALASGKPLADALMNGGQVREANAQTIGQLQPKRAELLQDVNNGVDGAQKKLDALDKQIRGLEKDGKNAFQVIAQEAGKAFTSGVGQLFDALIDGSMSAREAFDEFARNFVTAIAKMIVQAMAMYAMLMILNAIPGGAAVASAMGMAASHHTGGMVGSGGQNRQVNPAWFANAPKYHNGGIVGLAPDEVPAILKKNEEVLSTNDARNRLNGGGQGGGGKQPDIKIINAIDSVSMLREALASPEGERVIANHFQANRTKLKTIIG